MTEPRTEQPVPGEAGMPPDDDQPEPANDPVEEPPAPEDDASTNPEGD
jgi:hypothetical protein